MGLAIPEAVSELEFHKQLFTLFQEGDFSSDFGGFNERSFTDYSLMRDDVRELAVAALHNAWRNAVKNINLATVEINKIRDINLRNEIGNATKAALAAMMATKSPKAAATAALIYFVTTVVVDGAVHFADILYYLKEAHKWNQ